MATTEVVPSSDTIIIGWSFPASGTHYDDIDEGSVGMPDSLYISATNTDGDDNDVDAFNIGDPDIEGGTATQIVVTTYLLNVGVNFPDIRLLVIGVSDESQTVPAGPVSTNTFNGSWTEAQLANMLIYYTANVPDAKNEHNIYTCYATITYTTGYGHDYMGVPAANIGSVSGVPTENIASIKGV